MAEISSVEMGIRELRANLSETLGKSVKGQITYVTSHGLRIAAIVPVVDAEDIEARKTGTPAEEPVPADS